MERSRVPVDCRSPSIRLGSDVTASELSGFLCHLVTITVSVLCHLDVDTSAIPRASITACPSRFVQLFHTAPQIEGSELHHDLFSMPLWQSNIACIRERAPLRGSRSWCVAPVAYTPTQAGSGAAGVEGFLGELLRAQRCERRTGPITATIPAGLRFQQRLQKWSLKPLLGWFFCKAACPQSQIHKE